MSKEEMKLMRLILDAILYQLSGLEFSQEEASIEMDVTVAIKKLQDARTVYNDWLEEDDGSKKEASRRPDGLLAGGKY
jgi:hypothetical protein